jgi:hypothetical protein
MTTVNIANTFTIGTQNSDLLNQIKVSNYEPDSMQVVTFAPTPEIDAADEPLFGTHIREALQAVKALVR